MGWALLAWVAAFICAVVFGGWIGRSWSSLPVMRPGETIRFRGPEVGIEERLYVAEVNHAFAPARDRRGVTTVILASEQPGKTAP